MVTTLLRSLEQINPRNLRHASVPLQRLVRTQLWLQIILAMVLGLACGLLLNPDMGWVESDVAIAVSEWLALPGYLFLAFIQMIVIPLILASIVRGIAAATDVRQLKSTGLWVAVYFLATTVIAVIIGIVLGYILEPGTAIDGTLQSQGTLQSDAVLAIETTAQQAAIDQQTIRFADIPGTVSALLPTNPMSAIAEGQMLQIVIFAVVLGVGLLSIKPESAKPLIELLGSLQEVCMAVVGAVMTIAPLAVFGLLAQAMVKTGPSVLLGLGSYAASVVIGMAVLLVVYLIITRLLGGVGVRRFLVALREPFLLAFSTDSSAATMPITMAAAEQKLRVRPSLSQFIIPLGATINMGGTALYQGLAAIFMAQMFQMELPMSALIALIVTALGASIGTPAVPGVGIVVLATVLNSAGIPLSGLALIIGVDQVLERFRASLNVTGDLVACTIMDRFMPAEISKLEELSMAREAIQEDAQL